MSSMERGAGSMEHGAKGNGSFSLRLHLFFHAPCPVPHAPCEILKD